MKKIKLPDGSEIEIETYKKRADGKIKAEKPEPLLEVSDIKRFLEFKRGCLSSLKNQIVILESEIEELEKVDEDEID